MMQVLYDNNGCQGQKITTSTCMAEALLVNAKTWKNVLDLTLNLQAHSWALFQSIHLHPALQVVGCNRRTKAGLPALG